MGNSPGTDFVPRSSFEPFWRDRIDSCHASVVDAILKRIMDGSPEFEEAKHEIAMNRVVSTKRRRR